LSAPTGPRGTVGVVGPGAMGLGIVASLVRHGFRVAARDIRPEADARAAAAGATVHGSPAEVARAAPIVVVIVVDAAQIDEVLFAPDGILASGRATAPCSSRRPSIRTTCAAARLASPPRA
jgi:3-hydroxyisobutyrate dehydrogenase